MFDFHEKRKIKDFLYSHVFITILFLIALLLLVPVYTRFTVAQDMKEKFESIRYAYTELKQRASAVESNVEYLKDDRGIEEELRNRFDAIREGEQAVILLDSRNKQERESASKKSTDSFKAEGESTSFFDLFNF